MSDLERELRQLDPSDVFPRSPDLAPAVRARIAADRTSRPDRRRWMPGRLRTHPALAIALTLLVAAGAVLAASPGARSAIEDLLGLDSARIERGEPEIAKPTQPPRLGDEASLAEARRRAGFDVVVPQLPALGAPDRVALDPSAAAGGQVALVWGERPGLTGGSAPGMPPLVLTELRASRRPVVGKVAPRGTRVASMPVDGLPGYWLAGDEHQLGYLDRDGVMRPGTGRAAGNTLLWEREGLLLRLEGAASKAAALEIAESLGPA